MIEEFMHNNIRTKWINGYENKYAVREDGEIISYVGGNPKIKKQKYHQRGYKHIELNMDRTSKTFRVHRIVAEAFIDNPNNKPQIDHKDEVKDNNHYTNLRWCTQKENLGFYYKNKFGENWSPVIPISKEEIEQNKINRKNKQDEKIKNMPYGSVDKMISETSNPVFVNEVKYRSAREAAKMICEDINVFAKPETVRKEIQKFINGKRQSWSMYGKYKIHF